MPKCTHVGHLQRPIQKRLQADPLYTRASRLSTRWFATALWKKILVAMLVGAAVGRLWPSIADHIGWVGEAFIRLIRMLIVPLVLTTITSGISSLASVRELGSIGVRAIVMFVGLSALAASIGIMLALLIEPGHSANIAGALPVKSLPGHPIAEQLMAIIPTNPISAAANSEMLSIIFVAIVVGVGMVCAGESSRPLKDVIDATTSVMSKIVKGVMEVAPLGVVALITVAVSKGSSLTFVNISLLALAVCLGCIFQTLAVHGILIRCVARLPIGQFLAGANEALLVAFSTGSSSATLPVAITVSERNFGIAKSISATVLPLGASIGRDGTALYVALLAVFSAQAFNVPLHVLDYVNIVLATTLVALGTAPVPSASLFMLAAVLSGIGIDDAHTALIVGFILPFDSVFNMLRTVPNATSNLCVALSTDRFQRKRDAVLKRKPLI